MNKKSKRAEETAMRYAGYDHIPNRSDELNDREKVDSYYSYLDGYEQAEKDLSLTWEDVRTLFKIADDYEDDAIEKPPYLSQEYCEEVFRRYNEYKSK